MNLLETIVAYESGALTLDEERALFARLIATGLAYKFQGYYGRKAFQLRETGVITDEDIARESETVQ